ELVRQAYHIKPPQLPPPLREADRDNEAMRASLRAYAVLQSYHYYRTQTNFAYFLFRSKLEMEPRVVAARKAFSEADELRKSGQRLLAKRKYESPEAIAMWKELLLDPKNEKFASDMETMEDSFEVEYKYLRLVQDLDGPRLKEMLVLQSLLGQSVAPGFTPPW